MEVAYTSRHFQRQTVFCHWPWNHLCSQEWRGNYIRKTCSQKGVLVVSVFLMPSLFISHEIGFPVKNPRLELEYWWQYHLLCRAKAWIYSPRLLGARPVHLSDHSVYWAESKGNSIKWCSYSMSHTAGSEVGREINKCMKSPRNGMCLLGREVSEDLASSFVSLVLKKSFLKHLQHWSAKQEVTLLPTYIPGCCKCKCFHKFRNTLSHWE